jgi:hypothetical protein
MTWIINYQIHNQTTTMHTISSDRYVRVLYIALSIIWKIVASSSAADSSSLFLLSIVTCVCDPVTALQAILSKQYLVDCC